MAPFPVAWIFAAMTQEPRLAGGGASPPTLVRSVDPEYTAEARKASVQGTVLLGVVIGVDGKVGETTVLSPVGYGLDERAIAAVRKWKFKPGMKDGKPVPVRAEVEVNFRIPADWFDELTERQRMKYNKAIVGLRTVPAEHRGGWVEVVKGLASEGYPPAMTLLAHWLSEGDGLPKDPAASLNWLEQAARKNDGPAICELALLCLEGKTPRCDPEQALKQMVRAADLGSVKAQLYVGMHYEKAGSEPENIARAGQSFRLCAASGQAACQYKLGMLMLGDPKRTERDLIQAIAWLELASDQGMTPSGLAAQKEEEHLNADQLNQVRQLKVRLVRKP